MAGFLLFLLLLAAVVCLVWLGYQLARDKFADDEAELDVQRQVLDAEWTALDNTRRVNDVFFTARDAMRRAEDEKSRPRRAGRSTDPTVVDGEWEER